MPRPRPDSRIASRRMTHVIMHTDDARRRIERELRRQVRGLETANDTVAGWVAERGSDGVGLPWDVAEGLEMTALLRGRGAERARALARALQRLEAGTYGVCLRCDGPIAPERLDLMPEIEHCRDCAD